MSLRTVWVCSRKFSSFLNTVVVFCSPFLLFLLLSAVTWNDLDSFRCSWCFRREWISHLFKIQFLFAVCLCCSDVCPPSPEMIDCPSLLATWTGLQEGEIPAELKDFLETPTAHCQHCGAEIFISAFPVIFRAQVQAYNLVLLGLCCSSTCVRQCSLIVHLPLLYPRLEDLALALVLAWGVRTGFLQSLLVWYVLELWWLRVHGFIGTYVVWDWVTKGTEASSVLMCLGIGWLWAQRPCRCFGLVTGSLRFVDGS